MPEPIAYLKGQWLPQSQATLPLNDAGFAVAHDLPAGTYRVYAFEDFDALEGLDPAVLAKLTERSEKMTLAEGQAGRVAVKLIPAGTVELY